MHRDNVPFLGLLILLCAAGVCRANETAFTSGPGPHAVGTVLYDWHDAGRDRALPAKVYYPKEGAGPFPVIIHSHGLGGSREGYAYLGEHWASHGYVAVHVQHVGSDIDVWKDQPRPYHALRQSMRDIRNAIARPLDVRFAIDQVERLNGEDETLAGRMDLGAIGMSGHSFGAYTTMAAIGQVYGPPGTDREISLPDPRIKAAIPMSTPKPRRLGRLDEDFAKITIPVFHMTGTLDTSIMQPDVKALDRRIPFDHMHNAETFLLTLAGGDHMVFSGTRGRRGDGSLAPVFHAIIKAASRAFWDAYLKNDAEAKEWLAGGGFEAMLGERGTLEQKQPAEAHEPAEPPVGALD